ncbi:MAG: GAF domain-containing protein [Myxococcaceae bacterium]|nr:GAF domain-containing protein [Myxococcaceae bacterium]
MSALPIVLVMDGELPPGLGEALETSGFLYRRAAAHHACADVNAGWAELVVCGRIAGWQALAARVQQAGGAVVLWGPPPDPHERRALRDPIDAVQTGPALVEALLRAHAVLTASRAQVGTEDDLKERAECAERVAGFAQSIAAQIELPRVVEEAIARTRDLCDADGASLLLVDPATGEWWHDPAGPGAAGALVAVRPSVHHRIAQDVAFRAEPVLVETLAALPGFDSGSDDAAGFRTGSVIAAPLLSGGDLIGVLEAVRGDGRSPFTRAHLRRLEELAPHVAIAVYHAQLTARLRETQAQILQHNADLERRIAERTAQIARAKREWEATFDAIREPMAVMEGFVVRRVNTAWAQRARVDIRTVSGRRCHELLAGRATPCPGCPLSGNATASSGEVRFADGSTHRLNAFHLPPEQGRPAGVVVHYRDVTQERALERRVRESERLASIGQLASGAAHEINNPMGFLTSNLRNLRELLADLGEAVRGARRAAALIASGRRQEALASLAAAKALDEEWIDDGAEMVEDALSGAQRVTDIVRALRELSRQQVAKGFTDADVNASVTRAARAELGPAPPNLVLTLEPAVFAAMDPLQLDQALGHILRNARQATCGQQRIRIRTRAEGDVAVVEVQDEGTGIAAEHLDRIFEPFFTTRGVGQGIGLGLTAAWGIVQRHGGRIDVQSEPGKGSTFTLRLPRASGPADRAGEEAAAPG